MKKLIGVLAVSCVVWSALTAGASASITLGFAKITNNGNANVASQLSVEVGEESATQVFFTFTNAVGIASSITDVYFDDGSLLGIASISSSAGVAYNQPASPGNLSGGNAVDFNTTAGFSADSDSPVSPNGVDSSTEWVKIIFNLINGKTYADTLAAIALANANPGVDVDGGLRIGLHVQSIGTTGGSDSYVSTTVPEPTSIVVWSLLAGGSAGIAVARRRRRAEHGGRWSNETREAVLAIFDAKAHR